MIHFSGLGLQPADLLLPAPHVDPAKWACVACDQYTSQPEYWQETEQLVGDAPSSLHLVLPECWLKETETRVPAINARMQQYLCDGTLTQQVRGGFVLVERATEAGARVGLVGMADLEAYDFTGQRSLIRPTEETITARLPARLAIRRGAPLETSHILLLMDDPLRTVLEPLYARRAVLPLLYDFPLMQGGGHLRGWAVTGEADLAALRHALTALRDSLGPDPLLFAVGDGNHSLATAKARWEEIKAGLTPGEQADHPARFAMVEVENIHDGALQFEPIHRVLTGVDGAALMADWAAYGDKRGMAVQMDAPLAPGVQAVQVVTAQGVRTAVITNPDGPIPAATLQRYLDDFLTSHPEAAIDYIHGDDVLRSLASVPGAVGFLLPALEKADFFAALGSLGILPRKTFSMGHAHEKRFYMECRAIIQECEKSVR